MKKEDWNKILVVEIISMISLGYAFFYLGIIFNDAPFYVIKFLQFIVVFTITIMGIHTAILILEKLNYK